MSKASARDRLAQAAFALFDERGYEQTTVDDITERAGLGRSTFFRYYRSKDDVIFPDHDLMLRQVRDRLSSASRQTALAAVSDAIRLVLLHYIAEGDVARRRYALTSTVPALRDREIATVARYQRVLREFFAQWLGTQWLGEPQENRENDESASLRAEITAAVVVAAHNHVLRRWLRGESSDPVTELDEALRQVPGLFREPGRDPAQHGGKLHDGKRHREEEGDGTAIVAFRTSQDLQTLVSSLRHIIEATPE
ncbi:MAG: TetR family transcriptional regulator [Trebonia sp.]